MSPSTTGPFGRNRREGGPRSSVRRGGLSIAALLGVMLIPAACSTNSDQQPGASPTSGRDEAGSGRDWYPHEMDRLTVADGKLVDSSGRQLGRARVLQHPHGGVVDQDRTRTRSL